MKKLVLILLFIIPFISFSQVDIGAHMFATVVFPIIIIMAYFVVREKFPVKTIPPGIKGFKFFLKTKFYLIGAYLYSLLILVPFQSPKSEYGGGYTGEPFLGNATIIDLAVQPIVSTLIVYGVPSIIFLLVQSITKTDNKYFYVFRKTFDLIALFFIISSIGGIKAMFFPDLW